MKPATARRWTDRAPWSRETRAHLRWRLRQARANTADRRHRPFRYVHPVAGPLVYHPSDYLSRRLYLYDDFEQHELQFAVERAAKGGVILDVGANIGLYTAACARAAGARGRVIALEPGRATFAKLMETCSRLRLKNVTPLNVAASRVCGTARLLAASGDRDVQQRLASPSENGGHAVETRRLDDVVGDAAAEVTLLKIDVEGHETAALDAARRILRNGRVQLIVEFHPAGLRAARSSPQQLWDLLSATHDCVAVISSRATFLAPVLHSIAPARDDEAFNTMWVPRGGSPAAG
jgi:FkbM family methyltransferase